MHPNSVHLPVHPCPPLPAAAPTIKIKRNQTILKKQLIRQTKIRRTQTKEQQKEASSLFHLSCLSSLSLHPGVIGSLRVFNAPQDYIRGTVKWTLQNVFI